MCAVHKPCGVASVAWITDNHTFAVACDDAKVYIYSIDRDDSFPVLNLQRSFVEHSDVLTSLYVQPINKLAISAGFDGHICVWNVGGETHPVKVYSPSGSSIVWGLDGRIDASWFASAHQDKSVRLWDPRESSNTKTQLQMEFDCPCTSLCCFSENEIACGFENGSVALLDTRNPSKPVNNSTMVHSGAIHSIQVESNVVITGGDDGAVKTMKGSSSNVVHRHQDYVRCVSRRPNTSDVYSGGWDGAIISTCDVDLIKY